MVVFLSICVIILTAQEPKIPEIPIKKEIRGNTVYLVVDTTIVSERYADTIYMEQKKVMEALDSLNNKK